jgi:predicted TIM-barrel fold metal-dependent hydrolase
MIFDINAWLGSFPFRSLRDSTPEMLLKRMDRSGIGGAAVSMIDAIFHRNVQPANEQLAEMVEPFGDRLVTMGTINPTYEQWEDDIRQCQEDMGMKGIRLFPIYHGYAVDGPEARKVLAACVERNLPVSIPSRIEDPRQRNWMDPGETVSAAGIANLMAAVPGATVYITNLRGGMGNLPMWRSEAVKNQHWYVDLSLSEVHGGLDLLARQSGGKHLIFGTHVPFSYSGAALVKRSVLQLDEDAMEEMSSGNAVRTLGIAS